MSIKKISALLLAVLLIASTAVFSVSAVSQSYSYIYNYALKVKMDISSTGKKPYAYYYYDHSYKLAEEILSLSEETESIELQNKYDELKDFYENPWISQVVPAILAIMLLMRKTIITGTLTKFGIHLLKKGKSFLMPLVLTIRILNLKSMAREF
ncbi:hypothetical protein DW050_10560 [Ruminococcus sp. AF42-10]|nr:hypothetical protein [Ruminococcus sp. AF42-10]RGF39171.1 hypothetical protein DW050_10560 [Ruminococcus sp. AF42-10]